MRNTNMGNPKYGQRMVAAILRRQRPNCNEGRGKTLRECCKEIGIESYNLLSYIERGMSGITPERVGPVARAYELDAEDFQLVWLIGKSIDAGIPNEKLTLLFDRADLWDQRGRSIDGGDPGVQAPTGERVHHETELGNRGRGTPEPGRIDLRPYLRTLRQEWRSQDPQAAPPDDDPLGGEWLKSIVSESKKILLSLGLLLIRHKVSLEASCVPRNRFIGLGGFF
jgi:transcriptional regulator with XRE-family HTH domain